MPAIQPRQLVQAITDAIQDSGYSSVILNGVRTHPRIFSVATPDNRTVSLWVYVWTLTFGGRPNLPYEYRIQMTTVDSLDLNPNGYTVLMGFEPNSGMFAGFDLKRHKTFTPGSASVQIDLRKVQEALQDGLTFDRKSNAEIAVGIRPDQFMNYVANAEPLHQYGSQTATFGLLTKASGLEEITDEDVAGLPVERKRVVQTVSRLARDANFRQQVMHAYGNRCAVTRMQLRLVDAAHLLPVGAPGSTDHVTNGLALSPTYHRAFDNGLIYLDSNYSMKINPKKETQLAALRLNGGIEDFRATLGKLYLPPDRNQWPNLALISKANQFRQI